MRDQWTALRAPIRGVKIVGAVKAEEAIGSSRRTLFIMFQLMFFARDTSP